MVLRAGLCAMWRATVQDGRSFPPEISTVIATPYPRSITTEIYFATRRLIITSNANLALESEGGGGSIVNIDVNDNERFNSPP